MNNNTRATLVCDALALRYDFMRDRFFRADLEKEILIACQGAVIESTKVLGLLDGQQHTWFKCTCGETGCQFCDGGLGKCTVCNGFEGQLTDECCGFKLDETVLDAVYKGGLNYRHGVWFVMLPKGTP